MNLKRGERTVEDERDLYGDEPKEMNNSVAPAPIGDGAAEDEEVLGVTEYYPDGASSYEKKEEIRYDDVFNKGKSKTLAFSVVSLVTGILSIICCCGIWVSLPLGIIAIIFAAVSRKTLGYFDGMAIAGLILGIFGAVIGIMVIIFSCGPLSQMLEEIVKELETEGTIPSDM